MAKTFYISDMIKALLSVELNKTKQKTRQNTKAKQDERQNTQTLTLKMIFPKTLAYEMGNKTVEMFGSAARQRCVIRRRSIRITATCSLNDARSIRFRLICLTVDVAKQLYSFRNI